MNILLKKVRIKTIFSRFEPIMVEPLELCYLKALMDELGYNSVIEDELFHTLEDKNMDCHVIILTCYNVAENRLLEEAQMYRRLFPDSKIIAGGIHVQLNSSLFHSKHIDYVIHSGSLQVLKHVLGLIEENSYEVSPVGYDFRNGDQWIIGDRYRLNEVEELVPSREFFNMHKDKLKYLDKERVALVKGSVGCPYRCNYCYCREINEGVYLNADYDKMAEQIKDLDTYYIWIVDDVFLKNRRDAEKFIEAVRKIGISKKYIVYLRADFIINQSDILGELIQAGLDEVIIGFESSNEEELESYEKGINALDYPLAIRILKEHNLDFTALFMVNPSYEIKDFMNLYRFIEKNQIEVFTLSIFTPIKGTGGYDEEELVETNPRYFDFLHLVTKSKLPKPLFYLLFYGIHLRLIRSSRIRKFLRRRRT